VQYNPTVPAKSHFLKSLGLRNCCQQTHEPLEKALSCGGDSNFSAGLEEFERPCKRDSAVRAQERLASGGLRDLGSLVNTRALKDLYRRISPEVSCTRLEVSIVLNLEVQI